MFELSSRKKGGRKYRATICGPSSGLKSRSVPKKIPHVICVHVHSVVEIEPIKASETVIHI